MALFMALFAGRPDAYALRWENAATGAKGWRPATKTPKRGRIEPRDLLPLTEAVIVEHLRGRATVGLYPLMAGDTCRLLVCDFDGHGWRLDAAAYWQACRDAHAPAAMERSRSGDGAHVWMFFDAAVPAASARAVGAALLRQAMTARVEIDLGSYDRFFPAQDYLPSGGSLGNLIHLPLQRQCRLRDTTVFVDPLTFQSWDRPMSVLVIATAPLPALGGGTPHGAAACRRRPRRNPSPQPAATSR